MPQKYPSFFLFQVIAVLFLLQIPYAAENAQILKCSRCSMTIENSMKKFSVITSGRVVPVAFDDISCALLFRNGLCAMDTMEFDNTATVYDYYSGESVKMTAAVYVTGSLVKTPMASGIIAFKDKASAEKFLAEQGQGEILLFDALAVLDLKTHNK